MNKKLYVGNLLYEVTDDELSQLFAQAGTVTSAQVIRYQDTGRSKGFGFVEMSTEEEAQKAIDMFNGQDNKGRKLVVSEARPMQPRTPGGGGGYRRGGDRGGDRGGRGGYGDRGGRGGDMGGDMGNM
jgi:RNA recognition motif-containing protein